MMVQIHVHCAASNPDASATGHRFTILYLHPDASLIYWPLLELEWTPGSVRLLNLPVDEAKRGAVTVATLRSHFLHTLRLPSSLLTHVRFAHLSSYDAPLRNKTQVAP